jgi:uncharacterized protein
MGAIVQPLSRDDVAGLLAGHCEELRALGVRTLSLFGSVARGEARPDSDVDLLVEFDEVPGFVGYVRLRDRLADILGRPVDLVMASGLKIQLRERVLSEARRRVIGGCGLKCRGRRCELTSHNSHSPCAGLLE